MSYNNLDKITYTLILNSNDKISGDNNNATFDINFDTFLPREYSTYKVMFNFSTVGGYYVDNTYATVPYMFSSAKIYANFATKQFSYDSSLNCGSTMLGLITRDPQTTQSSSNTLSSSYLENAPKTINRPNQNVFTVSIYNNYITNTLLTDTNEIGNALADDMTAWTMIMEFIPITSSKH
jgi:hypothetical protein